MFDKKNLPLILALCVPALMIVLIAGAVYLPGIGKQPKYNFIYSSGDDYYYNSGNYYVSGNKLVLRERTAAELANMPKPLQGISKIYLYDVASKESKEISLGEAQKFDLDSSRQSPDGYEVSQGTSGGGDFFFGGIGRDYTNYYIRGHNRAQKLNLKNTGSQNNYYYIQFLGWVVN